LQYTVVKCKNKNYTCNKRARGTVSKPIHKRSEQHTWKSWYQGTKKNDHCGHCAHTLKGINVKVWNVCNGE